MLFHQFYRLVTSLDINSGFLVIHMYFLLENLMFSDILCAFCMLHAQSCPDFYIFYAYMSLHCVFIRPCWKHNARQLLTFLSAGTLFLISLLLVIFSWKQDTLCIRSCRASQPCSQLPSSSSRNKLLIFQGVPDRMPQGSLPQGFRRSFLR